eukprot:9185171-Alexandrium_andersonii.AAC.1
MLVASVLAFLAVYAGIKYTNRLFREPEVAAWPTAPMQDPLLHRGMRGNAAQAEEVPEPPKPAVQRDTVVHITYCGD